MNENAKISVIVPVYGVEDYLERCVQSIRTQTYTQLEIILVDDGSPDRCGAMCDDFASKDPRIQVIHQKNAGLSEARNSGIDLATGDLIGFVDSDDCIHPQMFEIMKDTLCSTRTDLCLCLYKTFDNIIPFPEPVFPDVHILNSREALRGLFSLDATPFTLTWNKLYKRELFRDIRFPKGKTREDEFVTHQILFRAETISVIRNPLYYYFHREGSIMKTKSYRKEINYADAQESRIAFFQEKNLPDLHFMALKRYCLWLLSASYRYRKEVSEDAGLFIREIRFRRNKHIPLLLKAGPPLSPLSKIVFSCSRYSLVLIPWLAYRRLYMNNGFTSVFFSDYPVKII